MELVSSLKPGPHGFSGEGCFASEVDIFLFSCCLLLFISDSRCLWWSEHFLSVFSGISFEHKSSFTSSIFDESQQSRLSRLPPSVPCSGTLNCTGEEDGLVRVEDEGVVVSRAQEAEVSLRFRISSRSSCVCGLDLQTTRLCSLFMITFKVFLRVRDEDASTFHWLMASCFYKESEER